MTSLSKKELDQIEAIPSVADRERDVAGDPDSPDDSDGMSLVDKERLLLEVDQRIQESEKHRLKISVLPDLHKVTKVWLAAVVLIVIFSGLETHFLNDPNCINDCWNFRLPSNVLMTLIGSTTAGVIGLYYVALKWLYYTGNEEKKKTD